MRSFLKIILVICAFALKANAQIYFNNTYNINQHQGATSLIEDSGYVVIGQEIATTYRSPFFIKTNLNGDTLWKRNYPRNQYAYYTGFSNSLIKTSDNNYAYGGTVINLLDTTNAGDCLLVKLNTNGDTLWTKNYGGTALDVANIVLESSDHGFVLIGSTNSFGNGQSDFYLVKTDSVGNFQYQRTYGTSLQEEAYSAIQTLDGGYLLSGYRGGTLHIVKTDSSGNFQWEKIYSGTAGQAFIKQLVDSTYIIVGAKTVTGLAGQAYMAKLTKTGVVIWQQTYGGAGDQQFYAIPIILNDGSIVCSGVSTLSSIPWGLLIKTDSQGNQQWLRTYYNANPNIGNYVYDVKHTSDNGFIMCGQAYSTLTDFWLVKVDSVGCEVAGCNVGVEEMVEESEEIKIYPNPSNGVFLVTSSKFKIEEIKVFNVLGEEILSFDKLSMTNDKSATIDLSSYANGIYFIEVQSENEIIYRKFVKE